MEGGNTGGGPVSTADLEYLLQHLTLHQRVGVITVVIADITVTTYHSSDFNSSQELLTIYGSYLQSAVGFSRLRLSSVATVSFSRHQREEEISINLIQFHQNLSMKFFFFILVEVMKFNLIWCLVDVQLGLKV